MFSSRLCIHQCIYNHILKVFKTISYKPLVRISPDYNFGAFEDKGKLFRLNCLVKVTVRPHEYFGRHFFHLSLEFVTYFNETDRNYSLPCLHDMMTFLWV